LTISIEMAERVEVRRLLRPEDWRKRQIDTLVAVGEANYAVGISFPKKDPIEEGIKAEKKYAAAVKKAIDEERRARALKATNIDEWFKYATEIGKGRLVEGVTKREDEVKEFVDAWQPMLLDHVGKIDIMPEVTDPEREARMLQNLRGLKALKGTWRRV